MPDPTPTTIPLPTLPHSGLCDAGLLNVARTADGTVFLREQCTCAAGLLRLIGGTNERSIA